MKRLTKRQVLLLHEQLLQEFGGTPGVRDEGLLDSALAAPFQTFDGQSLYPSVQAKAAQLGFGLVCNHPFVDGNKRIGTHVMLVFLALNGYRAFLHTAGTDRHDFCGCFRPGECRRPFTMDHPAPEMNTRSLLWQVPGFLKPHDLLDDPVASLDRSPPAPAD